MKGLHNSLIVPYNSGFPASLTDPVTEQSHANSNDSDKKKSTQLNFVQKVASVVFAPSNDSLLDMTPPEIKREVCHHIRGWPNLLTMRACSKELLEVANSVLIARINAGVLNLETLNIMNVKKMIAFFGNQCSSIFNLDLSSFESIGDEDIEKIANSFPKLEYLSLPDHQYTNLTNASVLHFAKLTSLKSFNYSCTEFVRLAVIKALEAQEGSNEDEQFDFCSPLLRPKLTEFNFVQNFKGLVSLKLSGCDHIEDFSFLKECKSLQKLDLSNCRIGDGSFLEGLKHLTDLDLSYNQNDNLTNFDFLQQLEYLRSLALTNPIDSKFLKQCMDLEILKFLNDSRINYTDLIASLAGIENLKSLTVCCRLTPETGDLTPLGRLTKLSYLEIDLWDGARIDFLQNLTQLTTLKLRGCQVDLSIFKNLNLKFLELIAYSGLQNVNDLQYLKKMTHLSLALLSIGDIAFLEHLEMLEELKLFWCSNIRDFNPLKFLINLRLLKLHGLRYDKPDLSCLQDLKCLRFLSLESDEVRFDLNNLILLTKLRSLILDGLIINNLSPLEHLIKLRSLSLLNLNIVDARPIALQKLRKLNKVNVEDPQILECVMQSLKNIAAQLPPSTWDFKNSTFNGEPEDLYQKTIS